VVPEGASRKKALRRKRISMQAMKTTCGAGGSQNNFGRDAEHKDVEL
jgi:hypothetical protein